ncbi:MAG: hypothetical protein ACRDCF_01490 [Mycoplasmoidaceae bacterium]
MKELNKDIIDNEEITINDQGNESIDITSDQIITLENSENETNGNIEMVDESEAVDESNDVNSDGLESIDEMEDRLKMLEQPTTSDNSLESTQVEDVTSSSFIDNIKYPVKHAEHEYALKNVLAKSNNGELEYMEEVKREMFNRRELIFIYPRMFFWKKWKARKINQEIIMEQEAEFQNNYQNVLANRNEYKAKFKEYELKQRKYKESLFKL